MLNAPNDEKMSVSINRMSYTDDYAMLINYIKREQERLTALSEKTQNDITYRWIQGSLQTLRDLLALPELAAKELKRRP